MVSAKSLLPSGEFNNANNLSRCQMKIQPADGTIYIPVQKVSASRTNIIRFQLTCIGNDIELWYYNDSDDNNPHGQCVNGFSPWQVIVTPHGTVKLVTYKQTAYQDIRVEFDTATTVTTITIP